MIDIIWILDEDSLYGKSSKSLVKSMSIDPLVEVIPESYSLVEREMVLRAYRVAEQAHEGQMRASGDPYISHCVAVAEILAEEMCAPPPIIAAGLLHDTVEDTDIT